MANTETYESTFAHVSTHSKPSELRITDALQLDQVYANQGLVGFGEVRDGAEKLYAKMLRPRLLGENPCNIDKLFRRIKQFGGQSRQGGGVSGIEIALWDLAGKAYGILIYQMAASSATRSACTATPTSTAKIPALLWAMRRRRGWIRASHS